ncbi:putative metallopeptidase [Cronobacter phage vB_CsaM_GAP32]|uniref:Putative metallopeptidase n=1 Tax=Cronobacter phage vB_CsaM_GAP32 TaxID=1141136 RepID=K4F7L7_9CAUD|nr:putative metallopeptidase [Cronobacter phage vB_CsaM_GAP32]AFC21787.1 putative metallopeptidase [Cronobacter phage vB_CsaM_GAP32]
MNLNLFSLDIETLATPEKSGYGIVVPNYAIVRIPEVLTANLDWLYIQLPIQEQLDAGLKVDASTMNFWFDICAQEFPLALCEMQKSFKLDRVQAMRSDGTVYQGTNIPSILKGFMGFDGTNKMSTKVFGNGCNFDCSILQENHRVMFGEGDLWHYASPNNVRTLRLLLTKEEDEKMHEEVQPYLDEFCDKVNESEIMFELCLHNPLFDAAKEALFVTYIMNLKKSA